VLTPEDHWNIGAIVQMFEIEQTFEGDLSLVTGATIEEYISFLRPEAQKVAQELFNVLMRSETPSKEIRSYIDTFSGSVSKFLGK